jgi:hypothetical protein
VYKAMQVSYVIAALRPEGSEDVLSHRSISLSSRRVGTPPTTKKKKDANGC